MHVHAGYQFFPMNCDSGQKLIEVMDRFDIDAAIVSSVDGIFYDFHGANEKLESILDYNQNRLFGYIIANPNYLPHSKELIFRYAQHPQFKGVKMHASWHNKPIDGIEYEQLFEVCEELELPVLIHSYVVDNVADQYSSPERIMRVAARHKNPLIIAHMGGNHSRMVKAVLDCGNPSHIYTDISTGRERASQLYAWETGRIDYVVGLLGASKVLFGSDFPPLDPAISFGMLRDSRLSEREKEMILFENSSKLFNINKSK